MRRVYRKMFLSICGKSASRSACRMKIGQIGAARREIHDFAGNQAVYQLEQEWLTHVRRCFLTKFSARLCKKSLAKKWRFYIIGTRRT